MEPTALFNDMNKALIPLLFLALLPTTAGAAYKVGAPHPGTVTATTYYSSGAYHGAVDLVGGASCGAWAVDTAVKASLSRRDAWQRHPPAVRQERHEQHRVVRRHHPGRVPGPG